MVMTEDHGKVTATAFLDGESMTSLVARSSTSTHQLRLEREAMGRVDIDIDKEILILRIVGVAAEALAAIEVAAGIEKKENIASIIKSPNIVIDTKTTARKVGNIIVDATTLKVIPVMTEIPIGGTIIDPSTTTSQIVTQVRTAIDTAAMKIAATAIAERGAVEVEVEVNILNESLLC
jgi:hypothetical protein